MANKFGDIYDHPASLGFRPFSARSIVISVLLGGGRPSLPVSAVMSLAELFSVPDGTMRTALSRMVQAGELTNVDGHYALAGRHLDRRRVQTEGRADPAAEWDGNWLIATVNVERRPVAARRAFRAELTNARLGELRPDTWLRPDNLGSGLVDRLAAIDDVLVVAGSLAGPRPVDLVTQLWPLDELSASGHRLLEMVDATRSALSESDPSVLPDAFTISAAAVRHLTTEPQLPSDLVPAGWPAHALRQSYDDYERAFQSLLHQFLVARI